MKIRLNNFKTLELEAKKLSIIGKFKGLMFSRRKNAEILLFEFKKPKKIIFHSLFCFFPFLIIWLDEQNNVIDKRIIPPFQLKISTTKPFSKVIEIPFNKKYSNILKIIDVRKI